MNKNAYVTLVCGDSYVPGALALAKSLRNVNSQAPLVVMYRDNGLDLSDLESEGCLLQSVLPLTLSADFCFRHSRDQQHKNNPFTKGTKPSFHNPLDNFLKLRLWELEQFNNVVFLDSDTIVLQNIDVLFSYPEGAAAPNVYQTLSDFQRMNSGVFTAKPHKKTFDRMCAALDLPDAYWPRTDQTFYKVSGHNGMDCLIYITLYNMCFSIFLSCGCGQISKFCITSMKSLGKKSTRVVNY